MMFGIDRMSPAVMAAGLVMLAALAGGPGARARQEPAPADPHASHGAQGSHGDHGTHGAETQPQEPEADHADHADHGDPADHSGHEGHTDPAAPTDPADHSDHAGHSEHAGHAPSAAEEPAQVPASGQPASTLRPDPLDAPAASSVADAQRSAELAAGHGGHGAHGTGRYRHVDVGRGPDAYDAAEEAHEHGAEPHQHSAEEPAAAPATAGYTCPMHPEVVSETPGTCPHCGMALVPRKGEE